MLLCVFVHKRYSKFVSNIEVDSKATGFAKVVGNKGGVAVTFRLLETNFCFISSHLAAKPDKLALRKSNFYDLLKHLRFGDTSLEVSALFDYFIFLGDTNFRIDCIRIVNKNNVLDDFFKAVSLIESGRLEELRPHDQLKKAIEQDNFMTIFKVIIFTELSLTKSGS